MIEIAPFHGSYLLIWKASIHFKQAVGGTSWSSFLVLHIFKDFICTEFDFLSNQFISITTSGLWWMECIKGFYMLLCTAATCIYIKRILNVFSNFNQCRIQMHFGTVWTVWTPNKCARKVLVKLPYLFHIKTK